MPPGLLGLRPIGPSSSPWAIPARSGSSTGRGRNRSPIGDGSERLFRYCRHGNGKWTCRRGGSSLRLEDAFGWEETKMAVLDTILETTEAERLATGFVFTEGPLWHPDGFYYFADVRSSMLYRLVPGRAPEVVRETTGGGNGTTFDLQGRVEILMDRFEGKRLNRPNDVVCTSDGSIYFTDPGLRVPLAERELTYAGVYRVSPDGVSSLVADFEYPNGLAFSPDERLLYVANTRWAQYIHLLELDTSGKVRRRRIFADMSSDETDGVPDGMKVDVEGRVYCTGPGGTWVFAPDGTRLGIIRTPEVPANLAFGGPDLKTLFLTARTSVYTLRVKVPGQPHPYYKARAR